MAFAIELYFDESAEAHVRALWEALSAASLPAWPLRIGARPHVSVVIVDEAASTDVDVVFHSLTASAPFDLVFDSASHFGADQAVLFIKPGPSSALRRLHDRAAREARARGLTPRHAGDEWVPHCTCDYGVGQEQVDIGIAILKERVPLRARVQEIGYVEVTPEAVRQIRIARLGVAGAVG